MKRVHSAGTMHHSPPLYVGLFAVAMCGHVQGHALCVDLGLVAVFVVSTSTPSVRLPPCLWVLVLSGFGDCIEILAVCLDAIFVSGTIFSNES